MRILNFILALMFLAFAFVQIKDPDPMVWILIYGAMAQIYSDFEDHEKALYWLDKSIMQESVNKAKRIWYRQFTLTSMDIAKAGRVQQALDFVLKITREYPPVTMNDKMNIAHILGYCYHHLNQKDLCEKYYACE